MKNSDILPTDNPNNLCMHFAETNLPTAATPLLLRPKSQIDRQAQAQPNLHVLPKNPHSTNSSKHLRPPPPTPRAHRTPIPTLGCSDPRALRRRHRGRRRRGLLTTDAACCPICRSCSRTLGRLYHCVRYGGVLTSNLLCCDFCYFRSRTLGRLYRCVRGGGVLTSDFLCCSLCYFWSCTLLWHHG